MSTINVTCADQVLTFTNMPVISSGNINADKIKFTFSSEWDGFAKICVFYQQKGEYYYGLVDENNEVNIPNGILHNPGNVAFGLSGNKDNVTLTSTILTYELVEGTYTEVDPEDAQDLIQVIAQHVNEMRSEYDSVVNSLAHVRIDGDNAFEYDEDTTNKILTALPSCVRMAQGSYVGDGTFGTDNPTSLTFPFIPSFLYVYQSVNQFYPTVDNSDTHILIWGTGQTKFISQPVGPMEKANVTFTLDNKTLSWYDAESTTCQCNRENETYYYIALGMWGDVDEQ